MMDHEQFRSQIDDYVDGMLGDEESGVLEWHLGTCAVCRAEVEAARDLGEATRALPREIAPSRDLWPGIAARLSKRTISVPGPDNAPAGSREQAAASPDVIAIGVHRPSSRRAEWSQRGLLAAAAVVLMVVSSTVTMMVVGERASTPVANLPVDRGTVAPPQTALVAFRSGERELIETAEELASILEARREALRPETVVVVEENLRIIDHAIAEARAALLADPNNKDLTLMLSDVYRKKVDLLQSAVHLTSL